MFWKILQIILTNPILGIIWPAINIRKVTTSKLICWHFVKTDISKSWRCSYSQTYLIQFSYQSRFYTIFSLICTVPNFLVPNFRNIHSICFLYADRPINQTMDGQMDTDEITDCSYTPPSPKQFFSTLKWNSKTVNWLSIDKNSSSSRTEIQNRL